MSRPASRPAELFAVEDRSAQVVLRAPRLEVVDVHGLEPGATQHVAVGHHRVEVSTLTPPPGPERTRLATLSDLHLGASHHFGVRDVEPACDPFPLRCARAAVREALAWGAEAIVLKGDLTHHGRDDEWEQLGLLLDEIPVPVAVMIGNHETHHLGGRDRENRRHPHKALADLGRPFEEVTSFDLPGARLVLADTTRPRTGRGRIDHRHDAIVSAAATANAPVIVMLHHHLERYPLPVVYPFGVPWPGGRRLLRALREANPAVFVTSGHSHRNRARTQWDIPITEVGSVKDFPGVWAGYVLHDGGVRQVVRRVAAPDCLAFTERTAAALRGLWGRWTPGRVEDRCLVHRWRDPAPRS